MWRVDVLVPGRRPCCFLRRHRHPCLQGSGCGRPPRERDCCDWQSPDSSQSRKPRFDLDGRYRYSDGLNISGSAAKSCALSFRMHVQIGDGPGLDRDSDPVRLDRDLPGRDCSAGSNTGARLPFDAWPFRLSGLLGKVLVLPQGQPVSGSSSVETPVLGNFAFGDPADCVQHDLAESCRHPSSSAL